MFSKQELQILHLFQNGRDNGRCLKLRSVNMLLWFPMYITGKSIFYKLGIRKLRH